MQLSAAATKQKVRDYYVETKPSVLYLLVFTAIASYIASSGWHISVTMLVLVSASVFLGSAGANTLGNYFDRDIDAMMKRTCLRPIPSGRITAEHAAEYGIALSVLSLVITFFFISHLSALAMAIGIVDYAAVYSFLLKRRSSLNIVMGGFSGAMPVLVAFFAVSAPAISLYTALFMGFLVFFWIPEHIWSLAIRFREDYSRAKIPMLPVVVSEKKSVQVIALTTIMMVAYSMLPAFFPWIGLHSIYIVSMTALGIFMLALNVWLLFNPSATSAWTVFKISSPYLFLAFVMFMLDVLVH